MHEVTLRDATDADRDQIIPIIVAAYATIGETFYPQSADKDLLQPATNYAKLGGRFVVLERAGEIIGTCAAHPVDRATGEATIRRLYLRDDARGQGHGRRLVDWAKGWARGEGFHLIRLWTDVLFTPAHGFYTALGFTKTGRERTMHDSAEPYNEYEFTIQLR